MPFARRQVISDDLQVTRRFPSRKYRSRTGSISSAGSSSAALAQGRCDRQNRGIRIAFGERIGACDQQADIGVGSVPTSSCSTSSGTAAAAS